MKCLIKAIRTGVYHLMYHRNVSLVNLRCFCKTVVNSEHSSEKCIAEDLEHSNLTSLLENATTFEERNPPDDVWFTPVYPSITGRLQGKYSLPPKVDPRERSVFLFPGQGVQHVGMGKSLLQYENVKEMFDVASEILRYNLLDLCLYGPKQMLDDTVNCQVAVMVTSLAAVEKLRAEAPNMVENCVAAAGFSVGEYTALIFSGAMTFEDGVRLLKIRGEAMQAASELCTSGMMTVMMHHDAKVKLACNAAKEWCIQQNIDNPVCCVAVYLFPQCRVIAGNKEALKFLQMNAKDFGFTKVKNLPVSGAFHSDLMKPAQAVLDKALKAVSLQTPLIAVHSNFDGKSYMNEEQIREKLSQQLCHPVKWEQIMHILFERPQKTGFPNIFECGPKQTLKTILQNNNRKAFNFCVSVTA